MDLSDPTAVALGIAEALRREGIGHALYGDLLLAAYGEARETKDADLAVVRVDAAATASTLAQHLGLHCQVAFERRAFGGLSVSRITRIEGDERREGGVVPGRLGREDLAEAELLDPPGRRGRGSCPAECYLLARPQGARRAGPAAGAPWARRRADRGGEGA
jgi:hypothetical protein